MASLDSLQGNLGYRKAAHLLRRTSFRYTKTKVDQLAFMTPDQAVNSLLAMPLPQLDQPVWDDVNTTTVESVKWINPPGLPAPDQDFNLVRRVVAWWLNEALHDPGIGHKMMFFWHQYLAVSMSATASAGYFDYLSLLRWGALGNFKKLATKMIADNAMLRYLNNNQNTAVNPNENFAREFFELFTIGKGPQIAPGDYTNYTEDDIVQAARVLTGIISTGRSATQNVDPDTGITRGNAIISRHDKGDKKFSDKFQGTTIKGATTAPAIWTEIDQFVNMVFAQPETAKNTCRRLYRYFVSRNITPEVENDIIVPLSEIFKNNNFEIVPVLKKLLKSKHFYDLDDSADKDEIFGSFIKSPLELSLQALSFFNVPIPDPITQNRAHYIDFYGAALIDRILGIANMNVFYPPDVAGYPAYHQDPDYNRQWFNSSTIIARYKWPAMLLSGRRTIGNSPTASIGTKLNFVTWVRDSGICSDPSDPYLLVSDLTEYLLPERPSADRFNYFYNDIFLDNLPPEDWTYEWNAYKQTGKDTEVKIALERLFNYILFSPEYQVF